MHSFIYLTKTSRGFSTGYKVIKTKKVPTMKEFIFLLVEMNKQQENKLINKIISDSDKWCQNKTGSYDRMTSLREGHTLLDWGQRGPVLSEKVTFELGPEWQERKSPLKIHTLFLSLSLTHTHTDFTLLHSSRFLYLTAHHHRPFFTQKGLSPQHDHPNWPTFNSPWTYGQYHLA